MILPPEIITIICRILVTDGYLGAATTLFSSSRSLHDLLAPIIYPELVLTPENGDQVYAGLVLGQSRLSTRPLQEINRLWPDIEISSEPDYDDDAEGAIDGGDNSITWPSETSHRRKLNVLRNVRRLVIRDIPCASLCNGLQTFIHFLTSSQAVNASVMFPVRRATRPGGKRNLAACRLAKPPLYHLQPTRTSDPPVHSIPLSRHLSQRSLHHLPLPPNNQEARVALCTVWESGLGRSDRRSTRTWGKDGE